MDGSLNFKALYGHRFHTRCGPEVPILARTELLSPDAFVAIALWGFGGWWKFWVISARLRPN